MANFIPLKNYMFYCLDKLISSHDLTYPFLDVGCGTGDLSKYLAQKGWHGNAIDSSKTAIAQAKNKLKIFPNIKVSKKSLFEENGKYKTIFLWDVLEHIENDEVFLQKLTSLLLPDGYILIAVPSNPKEWSWDDIFYGHHRRYTAETIEKKLINAKLEPLVFWDFTYPLFWMMRRTYTFLKSAPKYKNPNIDDKDEKTSLSSTVNSWNIPIISNFLNNENFLWRIYYKIQFKLFKNKINKGHEMFILAQINKINQ